MMTNSYQSQSSHQSLGQGNSALPVGAPSISGALESQADMRAGGTGWLGDYVIAGIAVVSITLGLMTVTPKMVHWFVLPAMLCGLLMGADVVRWLRGSIDPFDPKGLIGFITFFGFFIAPMLHVYWQIYTVDFTGDPRHWLGIIASFNALGLVLYKMTQRWSFKHTEPVRTVWEIVPIRLLPVLGVITVVAASAQFYFYFVVLRRMVRLAGGQAEYLAVKGYGWLLMLGDPLLILLLTGFITWTVTPRRNRNWVVIAIVLAFAAVGQFIWVGLRGSRSAIVVGVFWAVGLVHYYWRRLRPLSLVLGFICLVGFLYLYGFYKSAGWRAVEAIEAGESLERLERLTGRSIHSVLLGDLARADVQARIAYGVVEGHNNYQFRYGRTYLAALSKLIPFTIWEALGALSFKDDWGKGKAFVDLTEGKGWYHPVYHPCSRVFGLSGEAMLNFGLPGIPIAWFIFGLMVGWLRRKRETLTRDDTRWPLMLFLSFVAMMATVSDTDNIVFATFRGGLVVGLCIFLWSHKIKLIER